MLISLIDYEKGCSKVKNLIVIDSLIDALMMLNNSDLIRKSGDASLNLFFNHLEGIFSLQLYFFYHLYLTNNQSYQ